MTLIKTCGMFRVEDIAAVNAAHPDFCGFVIDFPKSHRNVTPAQVKELSALLGEGIRAVGVFVDEDVDAVAALCEAGAIDVVQLHGHEDEAYIARLRERCDAPVVKTFKVRTQDDIAEANASSADMVLLDNGYGTGNTFDWSLMEDIRRPFILAGGLTPQNLAEAIERWHPYCVDLSSGLETDKVKDTDKIKQAVNVVKENRMTETQGTQAEALAAVEATGASTGDAAAANVATPAATSRGRFGNNGGQYIPETLMNAVIELEEAYDRYKDDPVFVAELSDLFNNYANRPSLLYYAERMTGDLGGAKIYLKREDLNHTGAHKINNALGQALLAKKMGKTRLIAETGAGQHGVATATVAALLGMECDVYMGRLDMERQALNVYRMRLMGARVHGVDAGTATLKDAVSECMREWTNRIADTHYLLGSCMGPHPFPTIVRDFQSPISREIKEQTLKAEGKLPDYVIACVGGGSNAIGSFYHFIEDESVKLIGCEAAGRGIDTFETAATINTGSLGIFHGMKSYFCQDEYGQIAPVYSISAGLDYPGIGPEHAWLHDIGRAEYVAITDDEAVDAFEYLSRTEGIIPAIESAHALAYAMELAPTLDADKVIVVTLSGRGDKDCVAMARYRGEEINE